jgi:hypothetical protein
MAWFFCLVSTVGEISKELNGLWFERNALILRHVSIAGKRCGLPKQNLRSLIRTLRLHPDFAIRLPSEHWVKRSNPIWGRPLPVIAKEGAANRPSVTCKYSFKNRTSSKTVLAGRCVMALIEMPVGGLMVEKISFG